MKQARQIILFTALFTMLFLQVATAKEGTQRVRYKHGPAFIYRITLVDKQGSHYSLDHPTRFLSRRSIERRKRQGLSLDSTDLPVSDRYRKLIENAGPRPDRHSDNKDICIIGQSRWQNTLLVRLKDTTLINDISQLPCVKSCKLVWQSPDSISPPTRQKYQDHFESHDSVTGEYYGTAAEQIRSVHGNRLHEIGYRGEGMMIGIIDGGFKNANNIPAIQRVDLCGWHDFVNPQAPSLFYETDHGTKVLSAMAVNQPYYYVGTAPHACYWLLRAEDQQTEQEVEEDYWTMAAEFADSVGCDVINSSVGYNEYDAPCHSYQVWQLDGRTAFASRSAALLAQKGIVLVNSAGNSGMGPWKKISVPADAENILAVGAVNDMPSHRIAPFSSVGPAQDGRVKPDVVAIGAPARLVNGRGAIISDMGTSFSSPVVCGLVTCLWQAMPNLKAHEIIELVRQCSNNKAHPDNIYGYGMPNFWRAYMIGKAKSNNQKK